MPYKMPKSSAIVRGQKVPESGVLRACLDLLAAEKIWHRRWNTGAVKAGNRFFKFGQKGDADILLTLPLPLPQGSLGRGIIAQLTVWLECKSDLGRQTKEQIEFQSEVEEQGHLYLVIRDADDLKVFLKQNGVIKPCPSPKS